ncbi:MAG: hypothetical protein ACOYB2_10450 [Limnohabitans sp.]
MVRVLLTGNAPHEPQMTGFRAVSSLKGATPRAAYDSGRQVDPLGKALELSLTPWQPRAFGRDQRALAAIKAIRDVDPQAAQAVWNFLRLVNPGMTLVAMVGTEGLDEDAEAGPAQQFLDGLMKRVGMEYGGGGDQLHNVLTLALVTDGAVAAEVAPTKNLKDVEDWFPIEPILIAFRRDPEDHSLIIGQRFRDGSFLDLNPEQVFYVPLDPDVEDPYGRPPMLPALSAVFAKAQMLNDIRAAAHNAGYPRIDVEVAYEAMISHAPVELQSAERSADLVAWAERQLETLVKEYESMQVDDTFVHYDWVKINAVAFGGSAFDFGKLDDMLTRQVNSALKTLPILLGVNQTGNEGYGSVQWNIQVAAVHALQRIVKRMIEKLGDVSLELAGFQAHCRLEYDTIRTIDRLTEAQAETFEFNNLKTSVAMGWRDNEEASDMATGHQPALEEPMPGALGIAPPAAPAGPDSVGPGGGLEGFPATVDLTGEQIQTTKSPQKPKDAADAAWDLLRQPQAAVRYVKPRPKGRKRAAKTLGDWLHERAKKYREKAADLYDSYAQILIDQLKAEGIVTEFVTAKRDTARDIAESVFGLGYRREMKALLREAIRDGMLRAGATLDDLDALSEKLVRRIWNENKQYVDRIRNDLRDAIETGEFETLADVKGWLDGNAYREEQMGEYLAKQGIAGGFADWIDKSTEGASSFLWIMGENENHCDDCLERDGQVYAYDELVSLGFPGSTFTQCGSNCHCTIEATEPSTAVPDQAQEAVAPTHQRHSVRNRHSGPGDHPENGTGAGTAAAVKDPFHDDRHSDGANLAHVGEQMGFGAPNVGTATDVNAVIARGGVELFRGCGGHEDEMRTGTVFYGTGSYGAGAYTSTSAETGRAYAGGAEPVRMALDPGARLISIDDAERGSSQEMSSISTEAMRQQEQTLGVAKEAFGRGDEAAGKAAVEECHQMWQRADNYRSSIGDAGVWAASKGYDAIVVEKSYERYYVVLDQSQVTVEGKP